MDGKEFVELMESYYAVHFQYSQMWYIRSKNMLNSDRIAGVIRDKMGNEVEIFVNRNPMNPSLIIIWNMELVE